MKQRKKTVKTILLCIYVLAIILLLVNKTTIKLFHRFIEYHKLKADLQILNIENNNYKENLSQLEKDPTYIQKIAKAELGVIGEGEVLYIFEPEEENNEN